MHVDPAGITGEVQVLKVCLPVVHAGLIVSADWSFRISGLLKCSSPAQEGRVIYCNSEKPVCFSAFGYIFISQSNPEDIAARMIRHEMTI